MPILATFLFAIVPPELLAAATNIGVHNDGSRVVATAVLPSGVDLSTVTTALAGKASLSGAVFVGPVRFPSKTISELEGLKAAEGDSYWCSDCTVKKIVSAQSGTPGDFLSADGGGLN